MPVTPQQTIVDTSQDPSLGYIRNRDIQTALASGGTVTTTTDRAIVTNTIENVTRSVTKVIETNVLADWNATTGTGVILNKPNLASFATTTYVDDAVANVGTGIVNGDLILSGGVIGPNEFGTGIGMYGDEPTGNTTGGDIILAGGMTLLESGGPTTRGGEINISAGQGSNDVDASHGGDVQITSGPASRYAGNIRIEGGGTYGASGQAGAITIQSGSSLTGVAGNITIQSGVGSEGMQVFEGALKMRGANVEITSAFESVKVRTGDVDNNDAGPSVWEFDNLGVLHLPVDGDIVDSTGTSVLGGGGNSGAGLASRTTCQVTTASIANAASVTGSFTAFKGYALYKVQTSAAARVRLYTDQASRTTDSSRVAGAEPALGVGLITEIVTAGAETVVLAPAVYGFNNESSVTDQIPAAITNLSGSTTTITVTLTVLQTEV